MLPANAVGIPNISVLSLTDVRGRRCAVCSGSNRTADDPWTCGTQDEPGIKAVTSPLKACNAVPRPALTQGRSRFSKTLVF